VSILDRHADNPPAPPRNRTARLTAILVGLLVLVGTIFLAARLPVEARKLEKEADASAPPLDRKERLNVGLVMFVSQALQVFLVVLAVGVFFTALGCLIVDAESMSDWIDGPGDVIGELALGDANLYLTWELVRVAGAIAAFTGLYFTISMLTDDVYRREFLEELTSEMRESFCERAEYLRLRGVGST